MTLSKVISVTTVLFFVCIVASISAKSFVKREISNADDVSHQPAKRPFCNAFTGCGRKRSDSIPTSEFEELSKLDQEAREINNSGPVISKRPFCNAFTGCGRKRSASLPRFEDENVGRPSDNEYLAALIEVLRQRYDEWVANNGRNVRVWK